MPSDVTPAVTATIHHPITVDRELDNLGDGGPAQRALLSLPDAVPWVPVAWDDLRQALEPRGPESASARPEKA
jgi:hypothetical protein